MVLFRYANNEKGEQVDIKSLKEKQGKYYCIGCKKEMIPHFGSISHHFQHKANNECSGETCLHKLAKKVFEDTFKICQQTGEPFYIEFSQTKICDFYKDIFNLSCFQSFDRKINLLDFYTDIVIEETEDELFLILGFLIIQLINNYLLK